MPDRITRRAIATEFVERVNAATKCKRCGAQPIEWHREEHEEKPNSRISALRSQGLSVARIQREMDLCEPLCRSCHMAIDGRSARLRLNAPYQKGQVYVPPKPCADCDKPAKPLRRGRCCNCYIKHMGIR